MTDWLPEWGNRPKKLVQPFWWPPDLVLRQATSAVYLGVLSHWRHLTGWMLNDGFRCLPGAAGARGMGCIGFPSHPVWEMTRACNLNCIHCHVSGSTTGSELTTGEAKHLLDELAGVREFRMMAFTGGEPLLRSDLYELLAYSRALGFTNTIATNATLVDDRVAERLRDCGTVIAAVSLDGNPETHDMVRNTPGAFAATVKGMQALRRAGIVLHINITVMEHNVSQMDWLMARADSLGASLILVYQLVPVGRGLAIKEAALDKKANEWLVRFLNQSQARTRGIIEPVAGPQYWPFLLKKSGISAGPLFSLAKQVFHGCAAGRGFVYIKPDGQVWPCPFIPVSCGDLHQAAFSDIWATAPVLKNLRARQRLKGSCGECTYQSLCGGCRGRAWVASGDYLAEDPACFINSMDDR
ncbi:MAG: radical SAM protein [Dehalococcoidales bacterium]|nr:radical SAM protein [Dehalococcoidales bacterium]